MNNASLKIVAAAGFGLLCLVGCNNNKKMSSIPTSESVTDISAPAPTYTPAPQPVMASPMAGDSTSMMATQTPGSGITAGMGGSYTVKHGDTLYSIARSKYGDGKAWQKIASANPGLSPQSLKAGQKITLP